MYTGAGAQEDYIILYIIELNTIYTCIYYIIYDVYYY